MVSMAAAGSGDRTQHRRRLSPLQQILQLLVLRARSLARDGFMRRTLLEGLKTPLTERAPDGDDAELVGLAADVQNASAKTFGRSLSIRHVDAGSCNACELEIHALGNAFYDLERFGPRFVAAPRHADLLLVTDPVTRNMREALERPCTATPWRKWVIAAGACAKVGHMFAGSY